MTKKLLTSHSGRPASAKSDKRFDGFSPPTKGNLTLIESTPRSGSLAEQRYVGVDRSGRPDEDASFYWSPCQAFASSELPEHVRAETARDITPKKESE